MQTSFPFLISLLAFILVISGMVGIAVNLFYENGLINTLLGKIWDLNTHFIVTIAAIIVSVLLLSSRWNDPDFRRGRASLSANILLLLMMLAGVYFIILYITTGSLTFKPPV